jgi:hypothetical protein
MHKKEHVHLRLKFNYISIMTCTLNKKAIYGYAAVGMMLLFFCISCKNKTKITENTLSFDVIRTDETYPVGNGNCSCHLSIKFMYPSAYKDQDKLHKLQSAFIERMFSMQYAGLSPQQAVDSFKTQYVKDFQCENFTGEDYNPEDEIDFQYYLNMENKITYNQDDLVSFFVESEIYTGGAHGAHVISGYVIDLNTGEYITEDSFAGTDYQKNISDIIIKKIAKEKKVSTPQQLEIIGYNNISDAAPNGNFTIDKKGITYYFNEYEIAAYFIGVTKVFIPYEELKAFIANDDNPIAALAKRI